MESYDSHICDKQLRFAGLLTLPVTKVQSYYTDNKRGTFDLINMSTQLYIISKYMGPTLISYQLMLGGYFF